MEELTNESLGLVLRVPKKNFLERKDLDRYKYLKEHIINRLKIRKSEKKSSSSKSGESKSDDIKRDEESNVEKNEVFQVDTLEMLKTLEYLLKFGYFD